MFIYDLWVGDVVPSGGRYLYVPSGNCDTTTKQTIYDICFMKDFMAC